MLLLKQQFNAMGGANTVYLMTFAGLASSTFGMTKATPLVRPIMSASGLRSVAGNTVTSAGPIILAFGIGVAAFGQPSQFWNLIRNASVYRKEFKEVQKEHYY